MRWAWPVVWGVAMSAPGQARAYRPFDSTDAAVASPGDLELELGPVGAFRDADGRFLVVPAVILNVGIARSWEVVLEGRQLAELPPFRGPRWRVVDTALSLKTVLRSGALQGERGPSIATEMGALLPTVHDEPGAGAIGTVILSQPWDFMTVHWNAAVAVTRGGDVAGSGGLILEGPQRWAVRPVAEALGQGEAHAWLASGLLGAIGRLTDAVSLDAALRAGKTNAGNLYEVRAGLTCAVGLWRNE